MGKVRFLGSKALGEKNLGAPSIVFSVSTLILQPSEVVVASRLLGLLVFCGINQLVYNWLHALKDCLSLSAK